MDDHAVPRPHGRGDHFRGVRFHGADRDRPHPSRPVRHRNIPIRRSPTGVKSPWARGSSPWPTPTTRWSPTGLIAAAANASRRSKSFAVVPAGSSTRTWSSRSSPRSWPAIGRLMPGSTPRPAAVPKPRRRQPNPSATRPPCACGWRSSGLPGPSKPGTWRASPKLPARSRQQRRSMVPAISPSECGRSSEMTSDRGADVDYDALTRAVNQLVDQCRPTDKLCPAEQQLAVRTD